MSRMRMAAAALIVGLAATAFAAAGASAAVPEVGRCQPSTEGNYKYKGCIIASSPGRGAFEFHPGPGAKPKFEAEIGIPRMETVGKKKVGCSAGFLQGEWTGAKTATITLIELSGCGTALTKCASGITGSTIKTMNPLEGELGLIVGGEKPVVGLDIKPKSPSKELLTFICGQPILEPPAETWVIEGSVIGAIKPPNKMRSEFKLFYAGPGGKQKYQKFEGGPTDVLTATIVNEKAEMLTEQLGLTLKGSEKSFIVLVGEEEVELKAK
jgi:hypothetical protein